MGMNYQDSNLLDEIEQIRKREEANLQALETIRRRAETNLPEIEIIAANTQSSIEAIDAMTGNAADTTVGNPVETRKPKKQKKEKK
jgi:hypothetical protein